ncbi:cytochrome b5 domain-containing protein [archaeon]|nr:MAG: cytochrome b5 domain-containing protein [archaeon]
MSADETEKMEETAIKTRTSHPENSKKWSLKLDERFISAVHFLLLQLSTRIDKKMVKYYTEDEIAVHNHIDDCWVTIFDDVYDITELVKAHRGPLTVPLLAAAGGSISHWFNEKTHDLKTYMDPMRNIMMPYTPQGRFIHVPPPDPQDKWEVVPVPWWKESQYIIGKVRNTHANTVIANLTLDYVFILVRYPREP